jgi:hypothetical protein
VVASTTDVTTAVPDDRQLVTPSGHLTTVWSLVVQTTSVVAGTTATGVSVNGRCKRGRKGLTLGSLCLDGPGAPKGGDDERQLHVRLLAVVGWWWYRVGWKRLGGRLGREQPGAG